MKMLPQKPSFVRAHPSKSCSRKANLSDSETVVRPSILHRPYFPTPSNNQQRSRLPISVPQTRKPIISNKSETIYESVSSSHQSTNSHIYEIIGSERNARTSTRGEKPKVPPRNSSITGKKVRATFPVPEVQLQDQAKAVLEQTITMPNVLQPNVLKYFQQKLYQSFGADGNEMMMKDSRGLLFPYTHNNNNNNESPSSIFGALNPISGDEKRQQQIDMMLETAQFLATAAYLERAAQKVASSKSRTMDVNAGGYCGALQRAPPSVPPALARRLANRENLGFGKET
ncbi:uncharacterized protein LOC134832179 [Culicoides brevitarsis]|uniref:uncharacterized protein LOC134832179 n=1 Tax=Culicoides brevitarsis TaxID=469753 RepID=UPI00307C8DCD